jgi:hypothetical protein
MAEPSVIYDVKGLLKDLEDLTPGLKKQLIRDSKLVAKPIIAIIKSQIPTTAPLSGMSKTPVGRRPSASHPNGGTNSNPNGRTAWGAGKPANSVTAKFRSSRSRYSAVTPLLAIWVNSPMTAIADIAGKGSMRKARKVTNEYAYKDGSRRHQVTSQGRWMIRGLKERNLNNFVYPNVEDRLDDAQAEVKLIIDKYARMVNRKIG